jgi:hypothetical protein
MELQEVHVQALAPERLAPLIGPERMTGRQGASTGTPTCSKRDRPRLLMRHSSCTYRGGIASRTCPGS